MNKNVRIAGIQLLASEDREDTLKRAVEIINVGADEGAVIICLPQLFSTEWFPSGIDKANFRYAECEDGPTITTLRKVASEKKVVLICPIFEKVSAGNGDGGDDRDRYFSTAFVLGPDGEVIGKYRKMHIPNLPLWEERQYFTAGDLGFPVFDTPYARIGVQICWDVFFPEGFRALALNGAEVVFAPTASAFLHSRQKWERAIQAAAHANGFFVMRVNRIGGDGEQEFYGRSFCAGPDGEFAVKPSGPSPGVIIAEIDLKAITAARKEWVLIDDRRPEEYAAITKCNKGDKQ